MNATNMNCAECRDNLVACLEGLLDNEQARQCQAHLETCAACRTEYEAISRLQEQLAARGRVAAEVSLVEPVMRAVRQQRSKPERTTLMSKLFKNLWGFGLGAAATAAAAILIIALATPRVQAKAADVMAKGAQALANLTSVHFKGQMRTEPRDNFSSIDANSDFCTIELWKQFQPELKWRIEKPGRVAVMDGQQTIMYFKPPLNEGVKFPHPANSPFDTGWLQRLANLGNTISNDLHQAQAKGWKLELAEDTGTDGKPKSIVTVHATCGLPADDYSRNAFLQNADTRRVYRFDEQSEQLEAVQIYLERSGGEVLIFDLSQIDYDQPINPSTWQLNLPADVSWYQEPQVLPDNAKYASMTAEQAARAFFEACAKEDWDEATKFDSPITPMLTNYLGGLEIVNVGTAFSSKSYGGKFVPYEIKLKGGGVKKWNLALRKDNPAHRWQVDGGI